MRASLPWELQTVDEAAVVSLSGALGCSPLLTRLLWLRGHRDLESAQAFLRPALATLRDPHQMRDAEVGAARLARAVMAGELVCIYGDYDVDGVTAAALLASFLHAVGCRPRIFLPDRFKDGYGLQVDRIDGLCDAGVVLFVSVDCGSTACEAVARARDRGRDFIIVDHHQLGPEEPAATAHLNPRRPGCGFGDEPLSAVGVAMVLAQATRRALLAAGHVGRDAGPQLGALLELTALGTIADMVPLRGMNRVVTWHGLRRLGRSKRPGVQALAKRTKVSSQAVSSDAVGFLLAPRINAAGRVSDAGLAYELLMTEDPTRAFELAEQIEVENTRRRALQREVAAAAEIAAATSAGREHAVVVAGDGWHAGVLGIVAGRIKDARQVPTFVLAIEGDVVRGSGRSPTGYDLVEGLRAIDDGLLLRYGGHAHAAGVTLAVAQLARFRDALAAHVAATWPMDARARPLRLDAALDVSTLNLELLEELDQLEPCGRDNPRPQFLLPGVVLAHGSRVGEGGAWFRARFVEDNDRPLWARHGVDAFASAEILGELRPGDRVDVATHLERNVWNERVSLQASVVAVRPVEA